MSKGFQNSFGFPPKPFKCAQDIYLSLKCISCHNTTTGYQSPNHSKHTSLRSPNHSARPNCLNERPGRKPRSYGRSMMRWQNSEDATVWWTSQPKARLLTTFRYCSWNILSHPPMLLVVAALGFPSRKVSLHGVQEKPWHWPKDIVAQNAASQSSWGSSKRNDLPQSVHLQYVKHQRIQGVYHSGYGAH